MEEELLKIIKHYGIDKQLKYIHSEYFELDEAIINHELKRSVEYEIPLTEIVGTQEHIAEEIADVMVMLEQFRLYYDIPSMQITEIMHQKIERQLKRIEKENEKKQ